MEITAPQPMPARGRVEGDPSATAKLLETVHVTCMAGSPYSFRKMRSASSTGPWAKVVLELIATSQSVDCMSYFTFKPIFRAQGSFLDTPHPLQTLRDYS